jgi:hypothetical protein
VKSTARRDGALAAIAAKGITGAQVKKVAETSKPRYTADPDAK